MTETTAEAQSEDTTLVVSREVSHPVKSVWNVLLTPAGQEALLGPGGQLGDKGDRWEANDGTYGATRSFHPLEQIRFSWHAAPEEPRTLVDVHLIPEGGDKTVIEIRHENVGGYDPGQLTSRWEAALARIDNDALD